MIDLVLPEARFGFAGALMEMHHDRKQVFVDRFGWRLPAEGSWLEVDQFDNDYAVYLLARSAEGRHQGSVRLLPSSRPHMLDTLFSHLCPDGVPGGDDIWEISRLVTNPTDASGTFCPQGPPPACFGARRVRRRERNSAPIPWSPRRAGCRPCSRSAGPSCHSGSPPSSMASWFRRFKSTSSRTRSVGCGAACASTIRCFACSSRLGGPPDAGRQRA